MGSEVKLRKKQSRMTLILTIINMFIIIGIICVAKGRLGSIEPNSVEAMSRNIVLNEENGLNSSEIRILTMLADWIEFPDQPTEQAEYLYITYFTYIKNHYSNPNVELNTNSAIDIEKLIRNRNQTIYLEKESDIHKMSIDGREITIYLLKKIYELSGLELIMNDEGNINQIAEVSGRVLFQNKNPLETSGFRLEAFIITLILLLVLFSVCIVIAKKKQLYVKGGKYDGFDEKKFA
ncbi:MAG: hypothetical protein K0S76_601 [Herbinix sp.]|nr:hypothetical protein [Herbinix sp.]